jgi:hypothetical protein
VNSSWSLESSWQLRFFDGGRFAKSQRVGLRDLRELIDCGLAASATSGAGGHSSAGIGLAGMVRAFHFYTRGGFIQSGAHSPWKAYLAGLNLHNVVSSGTGSAPQTNPDKLAQRQVQ